MKSAFLKKDLAVFTVITLNALKEMRVLEPIKNLLNEFRNE